jgi:hypothetical protein
MERVVPAGFRALIVQEYPRLSSCVEYLRLMCRLLFSGNLCRVAGDVILDRCALASDEGKYQKARSRNYCGVKFLERFRHDVFDGVGFDWEEARWWDGLSRTAVVEWKPAVRDALERLEAGDWPEEELVFFVSGRKATERECGRYRQEQRKKAAELPVPACPEAAKIQAYLNNLHPRSFTAVLDHIDKAREYVTTLDEPKRRSQLRVLECIRVCPQQMYAPSAAGRTVRLFGVQAGLTGASRAVRDILCQDWVKVDLKNAQLAIAAKLWDMPEIEEFLREHGSIWPDLLTWIGVPPGSPMYEQVKAVCKEVLYATLFGMCVWGIQLRLAEGLQPLGVRSPGRLLQHRIMASLLQHRERVMQQVLEDGGVRTCYGEWLPAKNMDDVRSVMAQQAQAMELHLIYPIYELAAGTRDFRVMLHQHDGVALAFGRRRELWERRINEAVGARIAARGIETRLEWPESPVVVLTPGIAA